MQQQLTCVDSHRLFDGWQKRYQHQSNALNCTMQFSLYLPDRINQQALPCLYWLSGLTCTDENFSSKAGAQRVASELGIILVIPDTSPRGEKVADNDSYDLGQGAGFYLNATQAPWKSHFQMYDYIVDELPQLLSANFNVSGRKSIFGHSMGGHGALTIALKNANEFESVSAFAPIVAPSQCPWGEKAFNHYLGSQAETWLEYDTVAIIECKDYQRQLPMLVDQGDADQFLQEQLKTELLINACHLNHYPATIRFQQGYDHSYYFISSFIEAHIRFHAQYLNAI